MADKGGIWGRNRHLYYRSVNITGVANAVEPVLSLYPTTPWNKIQHIFFLLKEETQVATWVYSHAPIKTQDVITQGPRFAIPAHFFGHVPLPR